MILNNLYICPEKTLHELSYDKTNKRYLVESHRYALDFDKITKIYCLNNHYLHECVINKDCERSICYSNDALLINGNKLLFIEFKDGVISRKDKTLIRKKIKCSNSNLSKIINEDDQFIKENLSYIFVYNSNVIKNSNTKEGLREKEIQDSNARCAIRKRLAKKAKRNKILFGLDYFKNSFLKLATISQHEFSLLDDNEMKPYL